MWIHCKYLHRVFDQIPTVPERFRASLETEPGWMGDGVVRGGPSVRASHVAVGKEEVEASPGPPRWAQGGVTV